MLSAGCRIGSWVCACVGWEEIRTVKGSHVRQGRRCARDPGRQVRGGGDQGCMAPMLDRVGSIVPWSGEGAG